MFKFDKNTLPRVFDTMFPLNRSFHNYPTRQSNEFHLPRFRTLLAKSTFMFDGPRFWNSLGNNIQNSPSLHSFKRKLKTFLLKSYRGP